MADDVKSEPSEIHISRLRALQAIRLGSAQDVDQPKRHELADASAKAVEVDGRKRYFELRDRWSGAIVTWIWILILFNIGITIAVGAKWLDYSSLEWFITAVLVQTFLQIVGLGVVAVQYLFSDKPPGKT
ncbi:hypothetical protein ABIA24_000262 [Sinorhizobium fredii]|uniref:hypothetical protein n=1 Tax=Rhizobium fredii TaxID=380 RepID=UPI003514B2B6